jgi:3-oxoacyl-[acyl-carrier protein] reductase
MSSNDKAIIVTGSSRGLGLSIAQALVARGYPVVGCSRVKTDDMGALEAGGAFRWFPCEVGKESEEVTFFEQAMEWIGARKLYGLVNNAGIAGEGILATFPNKDSEHILSVNLLSALRLSRLALRVLLAGPSGGRIINISSIVGLRGYTGLAAYSASKAGMDGLTRALAREVGRRHITVNSVAPGYLETALSASLGDPQRRQIVNRTPLGRLGTVSDVTPVVTFLLSDEAGFITGQTLVVDGGISC